MLTRFLKKMFSLSKSMKQILTHAYDPVKAHEYYLLNRELSGRDPAAKEKTPIYRNKEVEKYLPKESSGPTESLADKKRKAAEADPSSAQKGPVEAQKQKAQGKVSSIKAGIEKQLSDAEKLSEKDAETIITLAKELSDRTDMTPSDKKVIGQFLGSFEKSFLARGLSDQDKQEMIKVVQKLSEDLVALETKKAAELKALTDQLKEEKDQVTKELYAKLNAIPPIPKGVSPKQRARRQEERAKLIAKLKGDANVVLGGLTKEAQAKKEKTVLRFAVEKNDLISKASDEVNATLDKAKEKVAASKKKVKAGVAKSIDKAKATYEKRKNETDRRFGAR